MIDILISAFLLSIVLLGIHAYFGLEIIRRGIIFTDLAVGQMAALGAAISILLTDGEFLYPISLSFALLGGILIAFASQRTKYVEAFIGLLYAFGFSAVFIILSRSAHGMEEFQKLMASDILYTPFDEILKTAIIYSILGLIIWIFNKKTTGFIKDVLFFLTFAITVTSSVKVAGVLIVFAILVSPALISLHLVRKNYLFFAWIIGTILNLVAIIASYKFDFPTGYTIVALNAFAAILVIIVTERLKIIFNVKNKHKDKNEKT
ncbi:MAG: Zinc ABC transporter, inner membrane permease protein ZnuB [Ignavibacteriae bacterium]|nr:MAG: Zinc ABC transporter, inner membrane permease protein ZnuB [Ignavibacteriota bacterium]